MVARLVDLALLLGQLAAGIAPTREARAVRGLALGAGEGLAVAETARGLLLHRARVVDGKVADYDIVAPTEWNFHPRGALARRASRGLSGPRRRRAGARGADRRPGARSLRRLPGRGGPMHEMALAEGMLEIVENTARSQRRDAR